MLLYSTFSTAAQDFTLDQRWIKKREQFSSPLQNFFWIRHCWGPSLFISDHICSMIIPNYKLSNVLVAFYIREWIERVVKRGCIKESIDWFFHFHWVVSFTFIGFKFSSLKHITTVSTFICVKELTACIWLYVLIKCSNFRQCIK